MIYFPQKKIHLFTNENPLFLHVRKKLFYDRLTNSAAFSALHPVPFYVTKKKKKSYFKDLSQSR
jgi:hypothetical protein